MSSKLSGALAMYFFGIAMALTFMPDRKLYTVLYGLSNAVIGFACALIGKAFATKPAEQPATPDPASATGKE